MTGDSIEYKPYQDVYQDFPDIEHRYFKQAIRFIDLDGNIYSGPEAVFQALHRYASKWRWVMPLYRKFRPFRFLADRFYSFVSRHRVKFYRITVSLLGKNPARPKHYWVAYLGIIVVVVTGLIAFS